MRLILNFLFIILGLVGYTSNTIYYGKGFYLNLMSDHSFYFAEKEMGSSLQMPGNYQFQGDSLILSTHTHENESIVFAIFDFDSLQLNTIYVQKEFRLDIPSLLLLHKQFYDNGIVQSEYLWKKGQTNIYQCIQFGEEKQLLSIEQFKDGQLNGTQHYYFNNHNLQLKAIKQFKEGKQHGKQQEFEALGNQFGKVKLKKILKYKNGKLKRKKSIN